MARYVRREGHWVNASTGEPMDIPERDGVCMPAVVSDIEPYRSPIDGKAIGSRSTRRYDLEANGCVEAPPAKKRGFKNPTFAAKRGLKLNEQAMDTLRT